MKIQCQTWLAPEAALKKLEERKKRKEIKSRRVYVWEWKDEPLHSRGHEDTQCSPSCVQLPDSPLTSFSVLPCDWKARSPTAQKPKSRFWKSNRERQANVALLGCSEAGLGSSRDKTGSSSNSGYCNPQPCCSSKTIAGLMHTPMTSETLHRLTALLEPEAPGASGEQAVQRGIPLSQNVQDPEPHIYSPSWRDPHPVTQGTKKDLKEI